MRRKTTKQQAKAGEIAPKKRNMNAQELLELQEMHRIVAGKILEANIIRGNTARIPKSGCFGARGGKQVVAELDAIARILDEAKNSWIADVLAACGYPKGMRCDINLTTGQITASAPANAS